MLTDLAVDDEVNMNIKLINCCIFLFYPLIILPNWSNIPLQRVSVIGSLNSRQYDFAATTILPTWRAVTS